MQLFTNTGNVPNNQRKIETDKKQQQEINSLQEEVDRIEEDLSNLSTRVDTETVTTTNLVATDASTNTLDANTASIDVLSSDVISATEAAISTLTSNEVNTTDVNATNIKGQLVDKQTELSAGRGRIDEVISDSISADTATITNLSTTNLSLDNLEAQSITTPQANVTTETVTNSSITNASIAVANIGIANVETETVHSSTVDNLTATEANLTRSNSTTATIGTLTNSKSVGATRVNLDPQLLEDSDYYLLKVKKGFTKLYLSCPGEFDLSIYNAYESANPISDGTPFIISHMKNLRSVFLYSMDRDYYYIQIHPTEGQELYYRYEAREEISNPDVVEYEYNGVVDYEWFYKPASTSEIIYLGNSTELYQMTVLGKFKAALMEYPENTEFDDITINRRIFLKDYYNTVADQWVYKAGEVNDYLSNIEDEVDGVATTRIDWRKRVAFRQPVDYLLKTEDSTEDVLDEDDNVIGERVIKANADTLMDFGTLANYNGKIYTSAATPIPGAYQAPYTLTDNGAYPDITNMPEATDVDVQRNNEWFRGKVTNGTIDYVIRAYPNSGRVGGSLTSWTNFINILGYTEVQAESTDVRTVYKKDVSNYPFVDCLMYDGNKIDKIAVDMGTSTPEIQTYSNNVFQRSYFISAENTVTANRTAYVQGSYTLTATQQVQPASSVNPITKLGTVDEGNWNEAGYVHSDSIVVKDSVNPAKEGLIIEPQNITWKLGSTSEQFKVWDYTPVDSVDWTLI